MSGMSFPRLKGGIMAFSGERIVASFESSVLAKQAGSLHYKVFAIFF
jgi:hypothetical protein